ncbi:hypothetical protein [Streptomyces virginiae]|uniref:hypothetical protein n=1 Tax=Streptomyces virginiae TaxID=1961 RepID=UPI00386ECED8|nr:hypothetical protein OG253_29305 [Streptomyces virginiae]
MALRQVAVAAEVGDQVAEGVDRGGVCGVVDALPHCRVDLRVAGVGAEASCFAGFGEGEAVVGLGEPAAGGEVGVDGLEVGVLVVEGGQLLGEGLAGPFARGAGYVAQGPPVGLGEVFFGEGGAEGRR